MRTIKSISCTTNVSGEVTGSRNISTNSFNRGVTNGCSMPRTVVVTYPCYPTPGALLSPINSQKATGCKG